MKHKLTSNIIFFTAIACIYSLTLSAVLAAGDISVTLQFDYQSYLEYEDIPAKVTISNKKSLPLIIDVEDKNNKNQLTFVIQRLPDALISQTTSGSVVKDLLVLPDEKITISVDISTHYAINSAGRYMVTAILTCENKTIESNTLVIDIVPGIEITSDIKEVPYSNGLSRKYSLRYWSRKGREYLFLRVDDLKDKGSHIVFNLGPLVRVTTPTIQADRKGNITIWHQQDKLCFVKTILRSTTDEISIQKQTFHLEDGRPYPLQP